MKNQLKNKGIWLALAFSFMLFIYAPLELYSLNKKEFWFDVFQILPILAGLFLLMFAVSVLLFMVLGLLGEKVCKIGGILYFAGFIATYVQGNFLVGNLPPLDGTSIDWQDYAFGRVESIVLWAVVILLTGIAWKVFGTEKLFEGVNVISICMTLMLAVTLISVCFTNGTFEKKLNYVMTDEYLYDMSEDANFIIFLIDSIDSEAFYEVLQDNPEYEEGFKDFTYYKNTVGAYPYTECAIPYMLSGDWYENDENFTDYLAKVYGTAPLFDTLEAENYRMGMYLNLFGVQDECAFRFENVKEMESGVNSYINMAKLQIKLIGLRYMPFELKRFCPVTQAHFDELRGLEEQRYSVYGSSNNVFYYKLQEAEVSTDSDRKCFKYIHIDGAHVPFCYDKDVNIIDSEEGSYAQSIQASLKIAQTYLDKLKEADVYDNSVIIIAADHGHHDNETQRHTPLLMIKGREEQHPFQMSEAPISHVDLPDAYHALLNGASGAEVFPYQEGESRERRFMFYRYIETERIVEYIQSGYASDMETMIPSGQEYLSPEKVMLK